MTRRAEAVARRVVAGAVFVGPYSPVAVGDYGIGPNHVLPTGGAARFCVAALGAGLPAAAEPRAHERARGCGGWRRGIVRVARPRAFPGTPGAC